MCKLKEPVKGITGYQHRFLPEWIVTRLCWTIFNSDSKMQVYIFSSVHFSCSVVSDSFATPWTAAHHDPLSFTISRSLLRLRSTELVMPSNHFILCCLLLLLPSIFPSIRVFASCGWSIGASASVIPMNIQGWFPLDWLVWSLLSKRLSRVFSSTAIWQHWFFSTQLSLWSNFYICTGLVEKP